MLHAKMATIGIMKTPTPTKPILVGREGLPELTDGLVLLRKLQENPILVKVEIKRQTKAVQAVLNAFTRFGVLIRHFGGPVPIEPDNLVTEFMALSDKDRH